MDSTTAAVAKETHVLMCIVTLVDHLTSSAVLTVQWFGGSVGSSEVQQSSTDTGVGFSLTFQPLRTTHGGNYTCQAVINISSINLTKIDNISVNLIVQRKVLRIFAAVMQFFSHSVPSPSVMVSTGDTELVSGSSLSLSCSIQPPSVDTAITISSHWTTPGGLHDTVNTENETNLVLHIPTVETADSGDYICSAIAIDSSGSQYIVSSELHSDVVSVIVSKLTTIYGHIQNNMHTVKHQTTLQKVLYWC